MDLVENLDLDPVVKQKLGSWDTGRPTSFGMVTLELGLESRSILPHTAA